MLGGEMRAFLVYAWMWLMVAFVALSIGVTLWMTLTWLQEVVGMVASHFWGFVIWLAVLAGLGWARAVYYKRRNS